MQHFQPGLQKFLGFGKKITMEDVLFDISNIVHVSVDLQPKVFYVRMKEILPLPQHCKQRKLSLFLR